MSKQGKTSKGGASVEGALRLTCRECGSVFTPRSPDEIRCSCSKSLALIDEVIVAQPISQVDGHRIEKSILQGYFNNCKVVGWHRAFYQLLRSVRRESDSLYLSTVCPQAAGWKLILPLTTTARILCIGAKFEAIPLTLAQEGAEVIVVDRCHDRLQSTAIIARALSRPVTCVEVASLALIPFEDSYFDAIVIPDIQDILQYYGAPSDRTFSVELLQVFRSMLQSKGILYLAGDNRFTFAGTTSRGAIGSSESARTRRARKSSTSGHSYRGYQVRLREAGFTPQEIYAPIPNHRAATEAVPLSGDGRSIKNSSIEISKYIRDRIALHPQFLKAFGHSFALIASKHELGGYSFLHEVLLRLEWQLQLPSLAVEQLMFGEEETQVICSSESLPLRIRIPLVKSQHAKISLNAERLKQARRNFSSTYLQNLFPNWICSFEQEGLLISVETRPHGEVASEKMRIFESENFLESVLRAALSLSAIRGSGKQAVVPLLTEMRDYCSPRILDPSVRAQYNALAESILEQVRDFRLPGILVHGRLTPQNIYFDQNSYQVSGIIDWRNSMDRGLPGWDIISLEVSLVTHRFGCSSGEAVLWLLEQGNAPGLESLWQRYCDSLQIHQNSRPWLILSYWLVSMWRELSSELAPLRYPKLRRNLITVLEGASARILRSTP